MPIFVSDEKEFLDVAKRAIECRVKKNEKEGIAKVKARTKRYLYTFVIGLDKLNDFLNKLKNVCSNIKEIE
ncbi:50S ribosomal protein L38E [Ignisphaera aggregans DSM 17230]|uniref:50S ribosomal protein L38E n=1 Tax=Ignisphaera aggregans (strain DSM 17230 / JCM 13409 / AQ1.S1) TaxID=583356 RepID=E0SR13_IGNAA|nr:50S ribosomal protein L38E [Ignisphaera aggregans DSM 17230]